MTWDCTIHIGQQKFFSEVRIVISVFSTYQRIFEHAQIFHWRTEFGHLKILLSLWMHFRALDSTLSNVSRLLWQKYRNLIWFLASAHCHRFREKNKEGLEERCLTWYFREGTHRPRNKLLYVVRRMPLAKEGAHAGWYFWVIIIQWYHHLKWCALSQGREYRKDERTSQL